jgi:hypothetical protein
MTASHITHAPSNGLLYISWFTVNYYFITLTIVFTYDGVVNIFDHPLLWLEKTDTELWFIFLMTHLLQHFFRKYLTNWQNISVTSISNINFKFSFFCHSVNLVAQRKFGYSKRQGRQTPHCQTIVFVTHCQTRLQVTRWCIRIACWLLDI